MGQSLDRPPRTQHAATAAARRRPWRGQGTVSGVEGTPIGRGLAHYLTNEKINFARPPRSRADIEPRHLDFTAVRSVGRNRHHDDMITACHKCALNGKGDPRCINCKRVNQDDIRIQKTPHSTREAQDAEKRYYVTRSTARPYTPKAEKTLEMINEVTTLSLAEFVALMHLARRGRSGGLCAALRRFVEDIRSYKPVDNPGRRIEKISRSCVVMKKRRLAERYPIVSLLSKGYGHGRIKK